MSEWGTPCGWLDEHRMVGLCLKDIPRQKSIPYKKVSRSIGNMHITSPVPPIKAFQNQGPYRHGTPACYSQAPPGITFLYVKVCCVRKFPTLLQELIDSLICWLPNDVLRGCPKVRGLSPFTHMFSLARTQIQAENSTKGQYCPGNYLAICLWKTSMLKDEASLWSYYTTLEKHCSVISSLLTMRPPQGYLERGSRNNGVKLHQKQFRWRILVTMVMS